MANLDSARPAEETSRRSARFACMRKIVLPWAHIGGFSPWIVSIARRTGIGEEGIWTTGYPFRLLFRGIASLWSWLPSGLRRRLPFQIVAMMSVRPYQNKTFLLDRGFRALSGIGRWSHVFFTARPPSRLFSREPSGRLFALIFPSAEAPVLPESFLSAIQGTVVVSGGTDATFPDQWDRRYRRTTPREVTDRVSSIKKAECVRWYAENLTSYDRIFSPIPGGVLPSPWRDSVNFVWTRPRRDQQAKIAVCANRERSGARYAGQFVERSRVAALSRGPWAEFVHVPEPSLPLPEYRQLLRKHLFTLCVEGGGIDPSPKAFEALRQGSIPIIKESPTADAYRHFPAVVVQTWDESEISEEFLRAEDERIRAEWPDWFDVIERMKLSYWVGLMAKARDTREFARPLGMGGVTD